MKVFNYACEYGQESVLRTLMRYGADTYHNLYSTLSVVQDKGHLNILFTLISNFALEKVFALLFHPNP